VGESKSDVLRGTLDLMILRSLELLPLHGSGLAHRLEQVTGGAVDVGPGSIFPALYRLEQKGLVKGRWGETESGRRARFYALTAAGRKRLGVEKKNWEKMVLAIGRVLS
jgi:PadR family transcriptional regulator, regulatory protein PadR